MINNIQIYEIRFWNCRDFKKLLVTDNSKNTEKNEVPKLIQVRNIIWKKLQEQINAKKSWDENAIYLSFKNQKNED